MQDNKQKNMNRVHRVRRTMMIAVALVGALGAGLVVAGPAQAVSAVEPGALTLSPSSGGPTDSPTISTSVGCDAPFTSRSIVGFFRGSISSPTENPDAIAAIPSGDVSQPLTNVPFTSGTMRAALTGQGLPATFELVNICFDASNNRDPEAATFVDVDASGNWTTSSGVMVQDSTTTLTANPNPATAGQQTLLTATVTAADGTHPNGSVAFFDGTTSLGTPVTLSGGQASGSVEATFSTANPDGESLSAVFTPAAGVEVNGSTGTLSLPVSAAPASNTSMVLSVPATTVTGKAVTLSATVTAAGGTTHPAGSVQFLADGANVGSPATVDTTTGVASTSTSFAGAGAKSITATFTPADATAFNASTSAVATVRVQAVLTTAKPTISGTARVGGTLTANPGAWGPGTVSFRYAWKANGVAIGGATAKTFRPTAAQIGKTVTVTVTGSEAGFAPAPAQTSAATARVLGVLTPTTPKIAGTVRVGKVLSANPGGWGATAVTFRYQWLAGGRAIAGATRQTLTLGVAEFGKAIAVRVTGAKANYAAAAAKTSAATAKVGPGTLSPATPKITGMAKVGKTLRALAGAWKPGKVSLRFQWLANGKVIKGATRATLKLGAALAGKKISVRVTGTERGYATVARVSRPTKAVPKPVVKKPHKKHRA